MKEGRGGGMNQSWQNGWFIFLHDFSNEKKRKFLFLVKAGGEKIWGKKNIILKNVISINIFFEISAYIHYI
jgi:hypothetical protein